MTGRREDNSVIPFINLERWKNIKTAFVRSQKPPKSLASQNSQKSYYWSEHLAFLQPYLKGGDTSGNLDVEDTATEESNTNQNDGRETLININVRLNNLNECVTENRIYIFHHMVITASLVSH